MSIWPVFVLMAVVVGTGEPSRADGAAGASVCAVTVVEATAASAVVADPAQAPAPAQPPTVTPTPPPATTRPAEEVPTPVAIGIGAFLVALALTGAAAAGVFRAGSIVGPRRLPPGLSVAVLLVLVIGGACWIGGQVVFFSLRSQQHARATGGQVMSIENLSSADLAVLATVPALVALLVVLAGDVMFGLVRPIGLALARLPRMLLVGSVGGVIALLLMYGSGYLLTVFYDLIGYEHPSEHELLGAMKDASPITTAILVFGACVMAPLFEEVLFRGHIQTLLTRLLAWRAAPRGFAVPPPLPVGMGEPGAWSGAQALSAPPIGTRPFAGAAPQAEGVAAEAVTPLDVPVARVDVPVAPLDVPVGRVDVPVVPERPGMRWLAVVLTSLVFASVHPLWTAPLIFLLSLCLGYAYERTGSLWVPIVMHAMFNISSTVLFLKFT